MSARVPVRVRVNGCAHERSVEPRLLLTDFLRRDLGLTGTHVGCEHGVCGACTVLLDGAAVRACLVLAVQVDGREVRTVEGLAGRGWDDRAADDGPPPGAAARTDEASPPGAAARTPDADLHPLQAAFREAHGLQCGFCTPGILMTLVPFLEENPRPERAEIRDALSGNLCRCTGYQKIVDAVELACRRRAGAGPAG